MKRQLLLMLTISSFILPSFGQHFQKYFGASLTSVGESVEQTIDGGFIICGYTNSFGTGGIDVYLIRTDVNGDTLWTKTLGGPANDYGYCVRQTLDGGYVITGSTNSFGAGGSDVYAIKTDTSGVPIWTKTYGGIGTDYGTSIVQTNDGGYIIVGGANSFGTGSKVYVIKTNFNGDTIWTKTFKGTVGPESGNSIEQTIDGGYIITGYTGISGSYDVYLIKTDGNGNALWAKNYGGIGYEIGHAVHQTVDGGYIIIGETTSFGAGNRDVYLIKTDITGSVIWARTFGGIYHDYGFSVNMTSDGGYILTGTSPEPTGLGRGVYLIKTDVNGIAIFTKRFGGIVDDEGWEVQQTSDGGFVIVGFSTNVGASNSVVYLIKTDLNGDSGCNQMSLPSNTFSSATIVGTPVLIVSSGGTIGNTNTFLSSGGIVTTPCTTVGISGQQNYIQSTISPNPFTSSTTISFNEFQKNTTITITNLLGQVIKTVPFSGKQFVLEKGTMKEGVYFVEIVDEDRNVVNEKIIVQ